MNKIIPALVIALLASSVSLAQHDFKFQVKGISDTTVYLANYFAGKMYYNDTTRADKNGVIRFKGEETKQGGIYAVIFPDNKTYFEVVVNEPVIEMNTSFNNPIEDMKVIKSEENKAFYAYMAFVKTVQKDITGIQGKLASAEGQDKKDLEAQLKKAQDDADAYRKNYIKENEGLLAAKVLNTSLEIEVPEFKNEAGEEDQQAKYYYYKAHYFDNVDLGDDRLLHTPVLSKKVEYYLTKLTPQTPDSVCAAIDYLVSQTADSSLMFKYIIQYSTNTFQKSDIMGMDAVFICIAEKYYASNRVWWLEEDKMNDILDMYYTRKNLIIGARAENIILPDLKGEWKSLYDVKSKYTVVLFWSPTCGHCKKEMPKFIELYAKKDSLNLEIYAISTEFENEELVKFIAEGKLGDWINVSDNPEINKNAQQYLREEKTTLNSLNFRDFWDIYSTPQVYVLDENKNIIAKKIMAEQVPDFIGKYEKQQADKAAGKLN